MQFGIEAEEQDGKVTFLFRTHGDGHVLSIYQSNDMKPPFSELIGDDVNHQLHFRHSTGCLEWGGVSPRGRGQLVLACRFETADSLSASERAEGKLMV